MGNYENIREYAEFAHTAAERGGVENYLKEIGKACFEEGVISEKEKDPAKMIAGALIGIGIFEGVKFVVKKGKSYWNNRKAKAIERENSAKQAIMDGVKAAEDDGMIEAVEDDSACETEVLIQTNISQEGDNINE